MSTPGEPISNSPIPRIDPVQPSSGDKPALGAGEEAQEPKPFSLPPEPGKQAPVSEQIPSARPSPMDIAKEGSAKNQMTPEQLQDQLTKLKGQLDEAQNNLQNPTLVNRFTQDHYTALQRLTEKMNPDMRGIAKNAEGEFNPIQHKAGEPVLNYITRWINGSQETLSQALNSIGTDKNPDPAKMLKLQYSVQRAVQRGELFASIVGASVSGVKTILSTQLG